MGGKRCKETNKMGLGNENIGKKNVYINEMDYFTLL